MPYQVKERTLVISGSEIRYITFGTGPRPLIMMQGLNTRDIRGTGPALAWMYRIFAKDYTVYLFDRRAEIRQGITVRELAQDTATAMDALQLKNADILGVSQGGMMAQYLAIDRPDLVHALVLAVTLSRNNDLVIASVEHWIKTAQQGNMKALIHDMAEKMYSANYMKRYKPLLPLLTLLQKPKDVQRFAILANACLTCNTGPELHKIRCPVLVIGGKQDRIVGGHASEELAEQLGCALFMYDEFGHAVYEEAKDFNKRVYEFFQGVQTEPVPLSLS